MSWADVVALVSVYPETRECASCATPAMKIGTALVGGLREDGDGLVLFDAPQEERNLLIVCEAETFDLTPHYEDNDIVLARMSVIAPERLRSCIERLWRARAPERAFRAYDAAV